MDTQGSIAASSRTVEQLERACEGWLRVDNLLRRLCSRLIYAAEGRAGMLDATLRELRQRLREPLEEAALESLLLRLTDAVRALDALPVEPGLAPIAPMDEVASEVVAPASSATASLLLQLIERLGLEDNATERLDNVRKAILQASDEAALAAQAEIVACMVNRHHRQLDDQRAAAEALLAQVTLQLGELTRYLDHESTDRHDGKGARHELDRHLTSEMDALGTHLHQALDVSSLHLEVQSRLGAIASHLKTFREREDAREREWRIQSERMSQRIGELERSAQSFEARLRQKQQLASIDPLTGIANRLAFEQDIERVCAQVTQDGAEACLLVIDIDHFKKINDRFGHAAGDRALRIVAEQLATRLRADDLLARYGGEEFVVLLPNTDAAAGRVMAENLRACIESVAFRGQKRPVQITLSCGVTVLGKGDTPGDAFDRADRALYRAKHRGRNRCVML
jgi:diguanylate cyclase